MGWTCGRSRGGRSARVDLDVPLHLGIGVEAKRREFPRPRFCHSEVEQAAAKALAVKRRVDGDAEDFRVGRVALKDDQAGKLLLLLQKPNLAALDARRVVFCHGNRRRAEDREVWRVGGLGEGEDGGKVRGGRRGA